MLDRSVVVVAAVNDEHILATTLALSPDLVSNKVEFLPMRGAASASIAYNEALAQLTADLVVFVHQDVYLPSGWIQRVLSEAERLDAKDASWAVMGVYGIKADKRRLGRVWSGDQQVELFGDGGISGEVASLDEVALILRTDAGLRFDARLPHFHLYGTDIVQTAQVAGFSAHVIDAPVIHNTVFVTSLGGGFARGYRFMQRKWAENLPITTSMTTITHSGLPFMRSRLSHWWHARKKSKFEQYSPRETDIVALAHRIGYESAINAN